MWLPMILNAWRDDGAGAFGFGTFDDDLKTGSGCEESILNGLVFFKWVFMVD